MLRFKLFPSVVSCASAIGGVFAVPAAPSATLGAGRFRRGVAVGLLLTMVTPFAPMGHIHAEEDEYEAGGVPVVEAEATPSVSGAAAVHGCAPFISSGSPTVPGSGVLTSGICVTLPVPWTSGIVNCQFCTCWYEMASGATVNLNQVDCGSIVIIQNPGGDDCKGFNRC